MILFQFHLLLIFNNIFVNCFSLINRIHLVNILLFRLMNFNSILLLFNKSLNNLKWNRKLLHKCKHIFNLLNHVPLLHLFRMALKRIK